MTIFTAHLTGEEKYFFVYFRQYKVILRNSEQINNYLNTNTDINNISCFNQLAKVFVLKKTFDSFYNSRLASIVNNVKFLELEYALAKNLLKKPRNKHLVILSRTECREVKTFVKWDTRKMILNAAKTWLGHKTKERIKYEKDLLAKVKAALGPIKFFNKV